MSTFWPHTISVVTVHLNPAHTTQSVGCRIVYAVNAAMCCAVFDVLCSAVPLCAMSCHVMLCHAISCCAMLCHLAAAPVSHLLRHMSGTVSYIFVKTVLWPIVLSAAKGSQTHTQNCSLFPAGGHQAGRYLLRSMSSLPYKGWWQTRILLPTSLVQQKSQPPTLGSHPAPSPTQAQTDMPAQLSTAKPLSGLLSSQHLLP